MFLRAFESYTSYWEKRAAKEYLLHQISILLSTRTFPFPFSSRNYFSIFYTARYYAHPPKQLLRPICPWSRVTTPSLHIAKRTSLGIAASTVRPRHHFPAGTLKAETLLLMPLHVISGPSFKSDLLIYLNPPMKDTKKGGRSSPWCIFGSGTSA